MTDPSAVAEERAAVVRWLRLDVELSERLAAKLRDGTTAGEISARGCEHSALIVRLLAAAIEQGDHL